MAISIIGSAIVSALISQKRTAADKAKAKQNLDDISEQLEAAKSTLPAKSYNSAKYILEQAYYFESDMVDQFNDIKEEVDKFKWGSKERKTKEFHEIYLKLDAYAKKTNIFKLSDMIKKEKTAFKPVAEVGKFLVKSMLIIEDVIVDAEVNSDDYLDSL